MSGSTESLGRKIAGAQDLAAVVRSMKALAASSIGQYERAVDSLGNYYRTVELGVCACLRETALPLSAPGIGRAPAGAIGAILFGSDQGLVGRFNEVLVEFAMRTLGSLPGKTKLIWAVGERMHALVPDASRLLSVPASVTDITPLVQEVLIDMASARERDDVAEIYLFHNQPKPAAIYQPVGKRLLPLDAAWNCRLAALPWPTKNLPQPIGEVVPTLEAFIREYFFVLLFQACAESLVSENASRLAAMQRAEKNIGDIIESLSGKFRRVRQESIDEELFEVVSGYESLANRQPRPRQL